MRRGSEKKHYQLSESKNRRIQDNNISQVFHTCDVGFDGTDSVFNILTKRVLLQPSADRDSWMCKKLEKKGMNAL